MSTKKDIQVLWDLAKKIAEIKPMRAKTSIESIDTNDFAELSDRIAAMVTSVVKGDSNVQAEATAIQQFNAQFEHFQDDIHQSVTFAAQLQYAMVTVTNASTVVIQWGLHKAEASRRGSNPQSLGQPTGTL